ncbi:MAG: YhbY family RNA-binding protein [Gammaproteobacteria bacterium]|nr:YhbY family RNA-binding protein [Gammaproteobacteria bacterium]
MKLNSKQIRHLRGLAHHRSPAVTLGAQGLTPAVLAEIEIALAHHELLKIKLSSGDKSSRHQMLERICEVTQATAVQEIGRMAVVFKPSPESRIPLP